jgi:cold shock CspA family protein
VSRVQATVKYWDPASSRGSVLLDDGSELAFEGAAVQVRGLRSGQRVQLLVDGGRVLALTIATLPFT